MPICDHASAGRPEAPLHKMLPGCSRLCSHCTRVWRCLPLNSYAIYGPGIKRSQARVSPPPKPRLPVIPDTLRCLKPVWCSTPANPDLIMLWAAACTGFFGFLRAGEFTTPSLQAYNPDVHLSLGDLVLDSHTNPTLVRVRIKQSKTDPFRHGVNIYLGTTVKDLCPVQALIQFLAFCLLGTGPLF